MMRRTLRLAALAAALSLPAATLSAAEHAELKSVDWPHQGIFGTFDRAAVQRGYQVYKEVCAGCHAMRFVAFRNLMEIGFSADQVKAIAAEFTMEGGPDDEGEMFDRPGRPSDYFPSPFPNKNAAKAANGGAAPPDLSLIIKAREGHENYVYSILTGYAEAPEDLNIPEGGNYNPYFPGQVIAMPEPLGEDAVEYVDGTPASVDQMAHDVTTFLAWAAEPKLEARKRMGFKVIVFLLILSGLLYAAKRKVWADVH